MELSADQQCEIDWLSRAIDATADPQALGQVARPLLRAWITQKASTNWFIRQQAEEPLFPGDPLRAPPPGSGPDGRDNGPQRPRWQA